MFCDRCKKQLRRSAVSMARRRNKNGEATSFMLVCPECAAEIRIKEYVKSKSRMPKVRQQKEHGSRPAKKSNKV